MLSNRSLRRVIILVFMALVGMSFSEGIRNANPLALIFAAVSLSAAIVFLVLLGRLNQQTEEDSV